MHVLLFFRLLLGIPNCANLYLYSFCYIHRTGIFQNEIDASYAYEASKQKHGQLVVGSKGKGKKAGKKSAAPPSSVVQPPKEQETSFEYIEEYANGLPALSSYCSRKDSSGPNPEKFDVVISATRYVYVYVYLAVCLANVYVLFCLLPS